MVSAYIGIGSNIHPAQHLQQAKEALASKLTITKISTIYQSQSVGFDGPDFLNQVIAVESCLSLSALMRFLKETEYAFGRQDNSAAFTSRTLDLDLLLYGDTITACREIALPSQDILRYAFVLKPLAEIAPDDTHPLIGLSYQQLWDSFNQTVTPLTVFEEA